MDDIFHPNPEGVDQIVSNIPDEVGQAIDEAATFQMLIAGVDESNIVASELVV